MLFSVTENKPQKRDSWLEVVTTPGEVREILKFYHTTTGSPAGIVNTQYIIGAGYYWAGISKDISKYVSKQRPLNFVSK